MGPQITQLPRRRGSVMKRASPNGDDPPLSSSSPKIQSSLDSSPASHSRERPTFVHCAAEQRDELGGVSLPSTLPPCSPTKDSTALLRAAGFPIWHMTGVGLGCAKNSSGRATRRNISEQLHLWESNHTAQATFDALPENCFFYISRMYEVFTQAGSHSVVRRCLLNVRITPERRTSDLRTK